MTENIKRTIIKTLLESKRVLITAHKNPDGDSIGSQLALAGFLSVHHIAHRIINDGSVPGKYKFLPGAETIEDANQTILSVADYDTAVILECSQLERIGAVSRCLKAGCTLINIDHHYDNIPFGKLNLLDTAAAAVGEVIYDLLNSGSYNIDKDTATNLYAAILTDTGRFHYGGTTSRCLRTAARLIDCGADPVRITTEIYYNLPLATLRLTGTLMAGMQYLFDGRLCVMMLSRKMMQEANAGNGDTEGLVNNTLSAHGVEIGILFSEIDAGLTKVSLRSRGQANVAEIAARYGGGGHMNASGCEVRLAMEKARDSVIDCVKDRFYGSV